MRKDAWASGFYERSETFARYNQARIEFLRKVLSPAKREVFDLIPLLLHESHGDLPGNTMGSAVPSGVSCFTPNQYLRGLSARYFPKVVLERKAKLRLSIVFLALMGSSGSVAFTEDSDLDFWVGIESSQHGPEELELLRDKLAALEQWILDTAGLETHFFIADLDRIRNEDYGEVSEESCGSALGKLLKDEFYRTGLFVGGRIPFYWLMPVATSDTYYRDYIVKLQHASQFPADNYVDLGTIHRIGREEFFGAALWQLLKGLRSPFKSVLKMALLDKYAAEGEDAVPLCEPYKQRVMAGKTPRNDPYIYMIEELRHFYTSQEMPAECNLVEKCFLLRSFLVSGPSLLNDPTRMPFFVALADSWGWTEKQVRVLAGFRQWNAAESEKLRVGIITFLVDCYQRIRKRTAQADTRITDRDLTVVGKKLVSFFKQQDDKVPFEFALVGARDIARIDIEQHHDKGTDFGWTVELKTRANRRIHHVSRRVFNPLVACAWCSLNRFFHGYQQIRIIGRCVMTVKQAVALMKAFDAFFPVEEADSLRLSDLLGECVVTHLYIIPNWDQSESGQGVMSLFVFYRNSMGELFYASCGGHNSIDWLFREILYKRVDRKRLSSLQWDVHTARGSMGATHAVTSKLRRQIRDFISSTT